MAGQENLVKRSLHSLLDLSDICTVYRGNLDNSAWRAADFLQQKISYSPTWASVCPPLQMSRSDLRCQNDQQARPRVVNFRINSASDSNTPDQMDNF